MTLLPPAHPAKYSAALLPHIQAALAGLSPVLDPCAGVGCSGIPGLIHGEIEFEWAAQCPRPAMVADARRLPLRDGVLEAAVSSFTYGNRMADRYTGDAKGSTRHTYRIALGRELTEGNTGALQWGPDYRREHAAILAELWRVLRRGGFFLLNISNHIRAGVVEPVVEWYLGHMLMAGWELERAIPVPTPRQRHGQNGELRVEHEWLLQWRKPLVSIGRIFR